MRQAQLVSFTTRTKPACKQKRTDADDDEETRTRVFRGPGGDGKRKDQWTLVLTQLCEKEPKTWMWVIRARREKRLGREGS